MENQKSLSQFSFSELIGRISQHDPNDSSFLNTALGCLSSKITTPGLFVQARLELHQEYYAKLSHAIQAQLPGLTQDMTGFFTIMRELSLAQQSDFLMALMPRFPNLIQRSPEFFRLRSLCSPQQKSDLTSVMKECLPGLLEQASLTEVAAHFNQTQQEDPLFPTLLNSLIRLLGLNFDRLVRVLSASLDQAHQVMLIDRLLKQIPAMMPKDQKSGKWQIIRYCNLEQRTFLFGSLFCEAATPLRSLGIKAASCAALDQVHDFSV